MLPQIILALALLAPQPHQPPAAASKPCVGVIVRVIEPGVEMVRRSDGSVCSRPAGGSPQKVKVRR